LAVDALGFMGPVGWLWNQIYVLVFQRDAVQMAFFGVLLFVAPITLAAGWAAVTRGARDRMGRPVVPDHIRSIDN